LNAVRRIERLILGAGGGILPGKDGQKPFEFMFTWNKQPQPFEEVAISLELGTVGPFGLDRKIFVTRNFRKRPHRFVGVHLAVVRHEQAGVYKFLIL
jgi:hypothetical protein